MNVLLDFVANHVHKNHPVYQKHKDWATELYLPDGTLNTEKWDEHRLTTWFDVFLPTLNLEKPEVYEMLSDSAVYWIKKYKLDGFRHDATKHIPEIFWQTLTHKLKTQIVIPEGRNIYQIGETYGSPQLIGSYVNTGQLDAQFDFNVYDATTASVSGNSSFANLARVLKTSQKYYGSNHLMGNITGNQDRARFISYASGSLRFDEDAKFAGWTREIGIKDSTAFNKCAILNAIVSTIPGIPVIFYGDEIGIPGGNDPDNRKMMRFEKLIEREKELKNITKTLLNFRRNTPALMFGDFKIIEANDNIFIFSRSYFDKTVILAINNCNEKKSVSFESLPNNKATYKTLFNSQLNHENILFEIKLDANSFDIITNQKIN
jgi:cyclomaltodextrinase